MKIRKATLKDAGTLAEIDKVARHEKKWWKPQSKNYFEKLIKKKLCRIIIAESEDNNILGYLQAELKDKSLWIDNIYVLNKYRNKAIAKKLFAFTMRDAKRKVAELINSDDNLLVFEKIGFKKTGNFMRYRK